MCVCVCVSVRVCVKRFHNYKYQMRQNCIKRRSIRWKLQRVIIIFLLFIKKKLNGYKHREWNHQSQFRAFEFTSLRKRYRSTFSLVLSVNNKMAETLWPFCWNVLRTYDNRSILESLLTISAM